MSEDMKGEEAARVVSLETQRAVMRYRALVLEVLDEAWHAQPAWRGSETLAELSRLRARIAAL